MKISTRSCRTKVQTRSPFRCHGSLYGTQVCARDGSTMYVVYSYGTHWPLFVWHEGTWYENADRYSVTTSKHRSAAHPHCTTIPASCDALKAFIEWGLERCPKIDRLVAISA
jgi:hypothetical protein